MQARLRALAGRLHRFWTWWRLLLAVAGGLCLALAVATDRRGLAFMAAFVALVPFGVIAGLLGDRVRSNHDHLGELASRVDGLDAAAPPSQSSAAIADAVGALGQQSHRLAAMPGPLDMSLLVLVDPDDVDATATFLETVAAALVTIEAIAVIDGTSPQSERLAAVIVSLMDRWPGLHMRVLDAGGAHLDDDWFDRSRASAQGRYLLPVDASRPDEVDVSAIIELALMVPTSDEPWVGRRHGATTALALYRRTALDEVGGRLAQAPAGEPVDRRLVAAGYVVDSVALPWSADATEPSARPVRQRLGIADPNHALVGRVVVVPMAGYHTAELVPLADGLADAGIRSGLFVADAWYPTVAPALSRCVHPVYAQPHTGAWLASLAALVVMNDWDADLAPLIDSANGYGVPTIAKVEGAQDFADVDVPIRRDAYRTAAHILCQGRNDVDALAGCRTHVVGSSRLERLWLAPPRPVPEDRLAVINVNFTHGVLLDARDEFVRTAIEACERAGIDYLVSAHPHQREGLDGLRLADVPMAHLLGRASVLVSRFSTVPFEAMALGVPFVYHNPHGELVPTFGRPDGAFDVSTDVAELVAALIAAAPWEGTYRERCAAFFADQVDIDPARSSELRSVEMLLSILSGTSTQ